MFWYPRASKSSTESGFPAANVDDRRGVHSGCPLYELKGGFKVRTVPADRVRGLRAVDILPMSLCIHSHSTDRLLAHHKPITNAVTAKVIRPMSLKSE